MAMAIRSVLFRNAKKDHVRPAKPQPFKKKHRKWPSLKDSLNIYGKKLSREHSKNNVEDLAEELLKVEANSASNPQGDEEEECSIDLGPNTDF